jgi:hypothetical protein
MNIRSTGLSALSLLSVTAMGVVLLVAPGESRAQVALPQATFLEEVLGTTSTLPGTVTDNATYHVSTASAFTDLTVSAASTGTLGAQAGAEAQITYDYSVNDPVYLQAVPLSITATGFAGSSNGPEVLDTVAVTGGPTLTWEAINSSTSGTQTASWTFLADSVGSVTIQVYCATQYLAYNCSGSIDPTITISPAFLLANPDVSLELSSNVTQTTTPPPTSVPMPATGWLLLTGLAGLGLTRRKHKVVCRNALGSRTARH